MTHKTPPNQPSQQATTNHRLAYQQLKQLKATIYKLEESNLDHLILYQYRPDWWRMGGNSALIYYHLISKQIGTKPKLTNDRDFYYTWHTGIITVHYLDPLKTKLAAINARFAQHSKNHVSFCLTKKFTPEEIKNLRNIESAKEHEFNKLVLPKVTIPGTYAKIRELSKLIIDKVNKVDAYRRQLYADEGAQLAWHIERNFISMANGRLDPIQYFQDSLQQLDQLSDWLAAVKDYHIFDNNTNLRAARLILELKSRLHRELTSYKKKTPSSSASSNNHSEQPALF